jgi:hypothetical protein
MEQGVHKLPSYKATIIFYCPITNELISTLGDASRLRGKWLCNVSLTKFNRSKPTGTNSFDSQILYILPTLYLYVLCLSENKHKRFTFYNLDENSLLRGTNWVFKCSNLRFVLKGLISMVMAVRRK